MLVSGVDHLEEFGRLHSDAAGPLAAWLQTVEEVIWRKPIEVRATYRTADVAVAVASGRRVAVFNIKGNKYRLVAAIDYALEVVTVLRVMTHREYSRNKWKELL